MKTPEEMTADKLSISKYVGGLLVAYSHIDWENMIKAAYNDGWNAGSDATLTYLINQGYINDRIKFMAQKVVKK